MEQGHDQMTMAQATACGGGDTCRDNGGVAARFDESFHLGRALVTAGLELDRLSALEVRGLEANVSERVSLAVDEIVERWRDEQGEKRSALDRIDCELQRLIVAERSNFDIGYMCDGCGYVDADGFSFVPFHGLFLCNGCVDHARDELRVLKRPLIEALKAEPTLERAEALGFQLQHDDDGSFIWADEDDDYDGASHTYADETEALEDLVQELTIGLH